MNARNDMVTVVTYGHYADDDDEMRLTKYVIPADFYFPGIKEKRAREIAVRVITDAGAPGIRGIENYALAPDGEKDPRATTCGTCGRSWDDGLITDRTPTPAGRCPWEYLHHEVTEERNDGDEVTRQILVTALRLGTVALVPDSHSGGTVALTVREVWYPQTVNDLDHNTNVPPRSLVCVEWEERSGDLYRPTDTLTVPYVLTEESRP